MVSCKTKNKDLEVVENLDIRKYTGTWYEIARLPNSFEKNLVCVSATYSLRDDGKITVFNKGHLSGTPSETKEITGVAWVPDPQDSAKLKVSFFWPFAGRYWVLAIDNDYSYALVGDPSRKFLWILARTKTLPQETVMQLLGEAMEKGFDTGKVVMVDQGCD
ncbi:MAG: lipocalin family protein [Bacteroidales bacterium]|nr:lipocalin family protein [Bacteroidales bacterium]